MRMKESTNVGENNLFKVKLLLFHRPRRMLTLIQLEQELDIIYRKLVHILRSSTKLKIEEG